MALPEKCDHCDRDLTAADARGRCSSCPPRCRHCSSDAVELFDVRTPLDYSMVEGIPMCEPCSIEVERDGATMRTSTSERNQPKTR